MDKHRVGLYVEMTCPGVDKGDAVNRAVHALWRAAEYMPPDEVVHIRIEPVFRETDD